MDERVNYVYISIEICVCLSYIPLVLFTLARVEFLNLNLLSHEFSCVAIDNNFKIQEKDILLVFGNYKKIKRLFRRNTKNYKAKTNKK